MIMKRQSSLKCNWRKNLSMLRPHKKQRSCAITEVDYDQKHNSVCIWKTTHFVIRVFSVFKNMNQIAGCSVLIFTWSGSGIKEKPFTDCTQMKNSFKTTIQNKKENHGHSLLHSDVWIESMNSKKWEEPFLEAICIFRFLILFISTDYMN